MLICFHFHCHKQILGEAVLPMPPRYWSSRVDYRVDIPGTLNIGLEEDCAHAWRNVFTKYLAFKKYPHYAFYPDFLCQKLNSVPPSVLHGNCAVADGAQLWLLMARHGHCELKIVALLLQHVGQVEPNLWVVHLVLEHQPEVAGVVYANAVMEDRV